MASNNFWAIIHAIENSGKNSAPASLSPELAGY